MHIEFKEVQKFTQWWLWLLLIAISVLPLLLIDRTLIKGDVWADRTLSDFGLILGATAIFAVLGLFFTMKLKTAIDKNGIQMHFFPFIKKRVAWSDIKNVKVVNYGFVGGWGIRLWTTYGTVYNIKGNKGLAVELKNGKKFLIGTQKETELKEVVEKMSLS
ncbi:MAG: phosphoethanolamine transferase domain-containing protein [Bacteroidota bacterium]